MSSRGCGSVYVFAIIEVGGHIDGTKVWIEEGTISRAAAYLVLILIKSFTKVSGIIRSKDVEAAYLAWCRK